MDYAIKGRTGKIGAAAYSRLRQEEICLAELALESDEAGLCYELAGPAPFTRCNFNMVANTWSTVGMQCVWPRIPQTVWPILHWFRFKWRWNRAGPGLVKAENRAPGRIPSGDGHLSMSAVELVLLGRF